MLWCKSCTHDIKTARLKYELNKNILVNLFRVYISSATSLHLELRFCFNNMKSHSNTSRPQSERCASLLRKDGRMPKKGPKLKYAECQNGSTSCICETRSICFFCVQRCSFLVGNRNRFSLSNGFVKWESLFKDVSLQRWRISSMLRLYLRHPQGPPQAHSSPYRFPQWSSLKPYRIWQPFQYDPEVYFL